MDYDHFKQRTICWTRRWLFELALAQIVVGLGLWALSYLLGSQEPPVVLAMSALALVLSGVCTMAVAAVADEVSST